jgi:oligosaccharide repeat unit polymerase
MWKLLFAPEILFLIGTVQSLFPYIIWFFNGLNKNYAYTTTYVPITIWITGYLSFWLGARLMRGTKPIQADFLAVVKWDKFNLILGLIFGLVCIVIGQAIEVYGGIPLLQYASSTSHVTDVNDLQNNASAGQFGLLLSLLLFLNALILMLIIRSFESGRKYTLIFLVLALTEIFGGLMAGKRQALLITASFIICGLALRYNNPFKPILHIANIPNNSLTKLFLPIALSSAIVWVMGAMIGLRTGNAATSGTDEILTYLELPLINLESQCERIGFGLEQNNFIYPLVTLLPYGLIQNILLSAKDLPSYPEPTASAGFYGALHWGWGLYGTIGFSFIVGLICKYLYNKSSSSIFHFLAYCQICWTLISAHSYNHFVTLMFIPVPVMILFLFSKFVEIRKQPTLAN